MIFREETKLEYSKVNRTSMQSILKWKHYAVKLFMRTEHKNKQHESIKHVGNIVQQRMWIIVIGMALRSGKSHYVSYRKGQSLNDNTSNDRLTERW